MVGMYNFVWEAFAEFTSPCSKVRKMGKTDRHEYTYIQTQRAQSFQELLINKRGKESNNKKQGPAGRTQSTGLPRKAIPPNTTAKLPLKKLLVDKPR